jgi:hypothetical protein
VAAAEKEEKVSYGIINTVYLSKLRRVRHAPGHESHWWQRLKKKKK